MSLYTECRDDDGKPCICAKCKDHRRIENLRAALECSVERESAKDAEIAKLRAELDAIIIRCKDDTAPFLAEIASLERLRDELLSALDAALDALEAAAAEGGAA